MSYIAFLWRNDLHFLHHHVSGPQFDELHEIAGEYYDRALADFDWFSEHSIASGKTDLINMSDIQHTSPYKAWNVIHNTESVLGLSDFVSYIRDNGRDYIEALRECRKDCGETNLESDIDEMISFWDVQVNYLNEQRAK
jgi:DNA-binding ferritin-like protein